MPAHVPSTDRRSLRKSISNFAPNILVFALLAGVLLFGHYTGWKMPKSSALFGDDDELHEDWCDEHLVPESLCIECKPDLLPKVSIFGFCEKHGVAECVIDHPELAQVKGLPRLPRYDTACVIAMMPRRENNPDEPLHLRKVQLASAETLAKAGIETEMVEERAMTESVTSNGELIFDPRRVAMLSTKAPGSVAVVCKTVGDVVTADDILAVIDASQVGLLKSELLQHLAQFRLRKDAVARLQAVTSIVAEKLLTEAETALQETEISLLAARQQLENLGFAIPDDLHDDEPQRLAERLKFLGIPTQLLDSLPPETRTANLLPLRAPFDGVLTESDAVMGMVVDTTKTLFTVVDVRTMWLTLQVRQEDARYIRDGLPVLFHPDDGDHDISGTISWISPAIDPRSRTLKVRVDIENPAGRLRDKTYGTGRIILREEPFAVTVPVDAVQSTAEATFVFVKDKNFDKPDSPHDPKYFHVRQVRPGAKNDGHVEILAGVLPGETVATKGSAMLLAHLLRDQFSSADDD